MPMPPIVYKAQGGATGTTTTSGSFTGTSGGMTLAFCQSEGAVINAPTYNGSAMTLIGEWTNTGVSNPRSAWYRASSVTSSASVTHTVGTSNKISVTVFEVTGQHGTPIRSGSVVTNGVTNGSPSLSIPSAAGDLTVAGVAGWYNNTVTGGGTRVNTYTPGVDVTNIVDKANGATGTVPFNWASGGSNQLTAVGFSIVPLAPSAAPTVTNVSRTIAGDQITVTATVTSADEAPSATVSLLPQPSGTTIGPSAATITGTGPYTATYTFTALQNGTYRPSVTAATSGGNSTLTGSDAVIEVIEVVSAGGDIPAYPSAVPVAPVITSGSTFSVAENVAFSAQLTATDANNDALTWSVTGGADQSKFNISSAGLLTMPAQNFEAPIDADANNAYVVQVTVTDGVFNVNQTITVTVTNVADNPSTITITSGSHVNASVRSAFTVTALATDLGVPVSGQTLTIAATPSDLVSVDSYTVTNASGLASFVCTVPGTVAPGSTGTLRVSYSSGVYADVTVNIVPSTYGDIYFRGEWWPRSNPLNQ